MMINRAHSTTSPEIPYCLTPSQDHQPDIPHLSHHQKHFNDFSMLSLLEHPTPAGSLPLLPVKADPGLPQFTTTGTLIAPGSDAGLLNYGISRTASCPPAAMADKLPKESFAKRKAVDDDKTPHPSKVWGENSAKKIKRNSNAVNTDCYTKNGIKESVMKEASGGSSLKENPKSAEDQKLDYIHVRARRGQATDSHSLAERVRREKISERMKYLQDLVPGCNKITGKAGMLDEIINYVQSLQRQVEFLSMKLATVHPSLDFSIEELFAKEVLPACSSSISAMEMANLAYLQYNSGQQMDPVCQSVLGMSEIEMIPEAFPDSSSLTQLQSCLPWDQPDLQSMYIMEVQQARHQSFPSQTYTGPI